MNDPRSILNLLVQAFNDERYEEARYLAEQFADALPMEVCESKSVADAMASALTLRGKVVSGKSYTSGGAGGCASVASGIHFFTWRDGNYTAKDLKTKVEVDHEDFEKLLELVYGVCDA
jgi:hypothetical protein